MDQRILVSKINRCFKEAGRENDWLHRLFKSLYEQNELLRFHISDNQWFKGASEILELVDELQIHKLTNKEIGEFANYHGIRITPSQNNKRRLLLLIQQEIKKDWKMAFLDFKMKQQEEKRQEAFFPLFDYLAKEHDLIACELPRYQNSGVWELEVRNENNKQCLLTLHELENKQDMSIRWADQEIWIWQDGQNRLPKRLEISNI